MSSRFSNRDLMEELRPQIEAHGYEVVSRWHMEPQDDNVERQCLVDYNDVRVADIVYMFTGGSTRGGMYVELGLALAWGKEIILIGEREECVFMHMPGVQQHDTLEQALEARKVIACSCQVCSDWRENNRIKKALNASDGLPAD